MIRYVKLKEDTEMPCLVCGGESRIFFVKNMRHTKKNNFYMCEKCFKSFKKDIDEAKIQEHPESDLAKILREKDPD